MFAGRADNIAIYASTMVTPHAREAYASEPLVGVGVPSSGTYAAANRILYYRAYLPACTIYKLFWLNGATASTNNFQVGLYYDDGTNKPGAAVVRGTSTLASGANVCQYDNIADTTVGAGIYWLAIWGSGTTATLFRRTTSGVSPAYLESSASLPATATPAAASIAPMYVFGLVTRSTP